MGLTIPEEDDIVHYWSCASGYWISRVPWMHALDFYSVDRWPARKRRRLMRFYAACVRRQLCLEGGDRVHLSKNPIFSGRVEALIETFPDARIVSYGCRIGTTIREEATSLVGCDDEEVVPVVEGTTGDEPIPGRQQRSTQQTRGPLDGEWTVAVTHVHHRPCERERLVEGSALVRRDLCAEARHVGVVVVGRGRSRRADRSEHHLRKLLEGGVGEVVAGREHVAPLGEVVVEQRDCIR